MSKKDKIKNIYYCVGCGKTHGKGNFYVSYSKHHANGVLFYCKDYIKSNSYDIEGNVHMKSFQSILRQLDVPYIHSIYVPASETTDVVGVYFRMYNSFQRFRGLTWADSEFEDIDGEVEHYTDADITDDINKFVVTEEMLYRWNDEKYNKREIRDLEKFYRDMHLTHTIVTPQHEKALVMICKLQLKMDKALEEDNMISFAKAHTEYQKLLQSSGLRPIDKIGGAEASGIRSFSQIFEKIEKEGYIKPAPIDVKQDIVDRTIKYLMNYTLKLLDKQILSVPPVDTPKVALGEDK